MTTQCSLRAGAVDANFDSIRAHTLLDASAPTGASADVQAAAEALREATGLLDSITVETGARVELRQVRAEESRRFGGGNRSLESSGGHWCTASAVHSAHGYGGA
jgi:hypothetical protein